MILKAQREHIPAPAISHPVVCDPNHRHRYIESKYERDFINNRRAHSAPTLMAQPAFESWTGSGWFGIYVRVSEFDANKNLRYISLRWLVLKLIHFVCVRMENKNRKEEIHRKWNPKLSRFLLATPLGASANKIAFCELHNLQLRHRRRLVNELSHTTSTNR